MGRFASMKIPPIFIGTWMRWRRERVRGTPSRRRIIDGADEQQRAVQAIARFELEAR